MSYTLTSLAAVSLLLLPGVVFGQGAEGAATQTDSVLPPNYQQVQELESDTDFATSAANQTTVGASSSESAGATIGDLQRILETEDTSHESISVNFGLRHRIDESPRGLVDAGLTPAIVFNQQLLELYLGQEVLEGELRSVDIGEEQAQFAVRGRAQLLGFIPVHSWYEISAQLEPNDLELDLVQSDAWYNFMLSGENIDVRAQQIAASIESGRYLSRLQLAASLIAKSQQVLGGSDVETTGTSTPRG